MPCSFEHERALWEQGIFFVAGIDEAGRGPLAGPVVSAAVIFLKERSIPILDDSKKLTAANRAALYDLLTASEDILWAISIQDSRTIDRINILKATHLAMREACKAVHATVHYALIDGLPVPRFPFPHTALVGGDGISASIAAASVIAKVTRDRLMEEFDALYPQYGFGMHKGYGTAAHLEAIRRHGPCPIHRYSFSPVSQRELGL